MAKKARKKPRKSTPGPIRRRSALESDTPGGAAPRAATAASPSPPPEPPANGEDKEPELRDRFSRMFAPPELYDARKREKWGLGRKETDRGPYIIELNLQHIGGLAGATFALREIHAEVANVELAPLIPISKTYVRCELTVEEWKRLLGKDGKRAIALAKEAQDAGRSGTDAMQYRAIYKLWPDFPVESHIYRSAPTIKADAASRAYDAAGKGIVWAVIDSGIDAQHPHFHFEQNHTLDSAEVFDLHRSFINEVRDIGGVPVQMALPDPDLANDTDERAARIKLHREQALNDDFGHGTHVAGIIAGAAPLGAGEVRAFERVDRINADGESERGQYDVASGLDVGKLRGIAPRCRLISLRVLDAKGAGRSSDIIRALDYVREKLNDNPKLLRVHGVNLSVGYEFDAEMFACGQSPICAEVNRLVQSGVVVVAAAGNTGYGTVGALVRPTKVGLSNTINDPGNADLAITVGATHRDAPHTFGVSYFSSKGPTGDGRLKPDLVAPGERITSCAAGRRKLEAVESAGAAATGAKAYYVEDSGTSMAAPHVSGAAAAFLSIRREFIGKPLEVKRIFCATATPLGRERYFEGNGLLDLIRAIQSV
jgi:subtilisin family serine protease